MQYRKSVFRSLTMISQLGICMMTPMFLCVFVGYQLDTHFKVHTMIPMIILGVLAGGRCAWQMIAAALKQEKKEDEAIKEASRKETSQSGISKPKRKSRV